jgi:hypothetical protein
VNVSSTRAGAQRRSHSAPVRRYADCRMKEQASDLGRKAIALVILAIAAWFLLKVVIGVIAAVAWIVALVLIAVGVIWALNQLL